MASGRAKVRKNNRAAERNFGSIAQKARERLAAQGLDPNVRQVPDAPGIGEAVQVGINAFIGDIVSGEALTRPARQIGEAIGQGTIAQQAEAVTAAQSVQAAQKVPPAEAEGTEKPAPKAGAPADVTLPPEQIDPSAGSSVAVFDESGVMRKVPVGTKTFLEPPQPAASKPPEVAAQDVAEGAPIDTLIRSLVESLSQPDEIVRAEPLSKFQAASATILASLFPDQYKQIVEPLLNKRNEMASEENRQRGLQFAKRLDTMGAISQLRGLQMREEEFALAKQARGLELEGRREFVSAKRQEALGFAADFLGPTSVAVDGMMASLGKIDPSGTLAQSMGIRMDALDEQYDSYLKTLNTVAAKQGNVSPQMLDEISRQGIRLDESQQNLIDQLDTLAAVGISGKGKAPKVSASMQGKIAQTRAIRSFAQQVLQDLGQNPIGNALTRKLPGQVLSQEELQFIGKVQRATSLLRLMISGAAVTSNEARKTDKFLIDPTAPGGILGWFLGASDNQIFASMEGIIGWADGNESALNSVLGFTGVDLADAESIIGGVAANAMSIYESLPQGAEPIYANDDFDSLIYRDAAGNLMVAEPIGQ